MRLLRRKTSRKPSRASSIRASKARPLPRSRTGHARPGIDRSLITRSKSLISRADSAKSSLDRSRAAQAKAQKAAQEKERAEEKAFASELKTFIEPFKAIIGNHDLREFQAEARQLLGIIQGFVKKAGLSGFSGLGAAEKAGVLNSLKSFLSRVKNKAVAVKNKVQNFVQKRKPVVAPEKPVVRQTAKAYEPIAAEMPTPQPTSAGIGGNKVLLIGGALAAGTLLYSVMGKKKKSPSKSLSGVKRRRKSTPRSKAKSKRRVPVVEM